MCRSADQPGGPRRCPSDARDNYERARSERDRLAARAGELTSQLDATRTYSSARAFRSALNDRIRLASEQSGLQHNDIARRFVLQQFLSRVFADERPGWMLTGGTALQIRSPEARSTTDVDIAAGIEARDLHAVLTEATERRGGEHGEFDITLNPALGPGSFTGTIVYGLEGRRFAAAKIDIATGHDIPFPAEPLTAAPVVDIDDVHPMPAVPVYPVAAHLADKVAAMYEIHGDGKVASSRPHDLADIVILSRCTAVDAGELRQALDLQQQRRRVSVPQRLVLPDDSWHQAYPPRVKGTPLPAELHTADGALAEANRFLGPVLLGTVDHHRWDPDRQTWLARDRKD
ncbi:hypothetical protein B7435_16785 [Mycolicibacterium peregrinum]|uniref:nucleotidyl transferase AbiEii/AbiGii toxin family protein n=1 Tax=Mycolicibacterium peregrinum TaxID=43304 RepID=UPI000B4AD9C1|nr:nucleotidyl transferase AbiEii/AbiGii toxin family protein [Mycolicibacterium peregrinum]OWM01220.1 hypothetical protein B7435_16785 [Mycolicibacterium peregrinum]